MNKHIELAALKAAISENTFVFEASTVGNPDRMGDVILPGAFSKAVMAQAIRKGWADVAHEWEGKPIGFFTSIRMEGDTLVMEGTFHSTSHAQDMRTIVKERQDAGKETAVSIGFSPNYENSPMFNSGADLLKWCEANGHDTSKLDVKAIKKLEWCRAITEVTELFECSVCNVGMNPRAKVREAKQFDGEEEDRGLSLADHLDQAHGALTRATSVLELRKEEGKDLSPDRWAQVEAIHAAAKALLDAKAAPAPDPESQEAPDLTRLTLAQAYMALR
jgi:phage head maturation protease